MSLETVLDFPECLKLCKLINMIEKRRVYQRQLFTARKRSLRKLCFYKCLSVILFTRGGGSAQRNAGIHPSPGRHLLPLGRLPQALRDTVNKRAGGRVRYWDTINERVVRILLECILVISISRGIPCTPPLHHTRPPSPCMPPLSCTSPATMQAPQ